MNGQSLQGFREWCAAGLAVIVLSLPTNLRAAIQFTEIFTGISNVAPGTVAWGDYDSDGDLDVFVSGQGVMAVWRNSGNGSFTLAGPGQPGWDIPFQYFGAVAWGDFDSDGDLDAVEAGHDAGASYYGHIIHNFETTLRQTYYMGSLAAPHPPAVSSALALGDLDNDGVPEILVAGQYQTRLYHFQQGLWSQLPIVLPGVHLPAAAWSDYDQDGDLDLVLCGTTTNGSMTTLFRNLGDGVFTDSGVVFPAVTLGSVAWGDFDNDGDDDLLLTGQAAGLGPIARIYRNEGGAFTDIGAGLPGVEYSKAVWGDFDNDGRLDMLMAGREAGGPRTRLFRNLGHGSFTNVALALPQVDRSSISLGDFDHDGALDIMLLGMNVSNTPLVRLLRNTSATTNTPPAPPTGLQVVYTGSSLTLNWNPALDAEQTNGLTYNVRIGTAPGTGNVFSAMALPASGRRLVPQPGNAGHRLSWTLTNLSGGNYYATVQAIDHALAGSVFASEVSVTPPIISSGPNQSMSLDTVLGPLPVTIGDRETPADQLVLTGHSSDTNLLPDSAIVFGGAGSNRTVTLTPRTHLVGSTVVALRVADSNAGTNHSSFVLTVTNPPPTISDIPSLVIPFNTTSPPLPFVIGDFGTAVDELLLSAHSSDSNLVPLTAIQFAGSGSNRTVTLTPPAGLTGASVITITVQDSHGATDSDAFTLTVTNPPPSISDLANQSIVFNSATPPLPFVIGDFETPADALVLSAHSSNPNLMPVEAIEFGGAASHRTVTLTPRANTAGLAVITITVQDSSGATNSDSFVLTVTNLPPTISVVNDLLVYPSDPVPTVAVMVGDAETAAANLVLTATADGTNLVESFTLGGFGSNRLVQILPRASARGSDTISLVVADAAGATATNRFTFRIGEFAPVAAGLTNLQNGGVAWGDYDNDGRLDALVFGRTASGASITRLQHNNGDGTFSDIDAGLPGLAFGTAAWGDYDNDGRLDLLLAAYPVAGIYRNLGGGAFTNLGPSISVGQNGAALAWGDCDNDGDLDFILTGGSLPQLYRNNGDHTFTNLPAAFPAGTGGAVAWGDYDGDGDLDLAFVTGGIFRNEGAGAFAAVPTGLPILFRGALAWGDCDNDGDLDLLVSGAAAAPFTRLARNNGDETFTVLTNALPNHGATSVAWGDFDQDGYLDILLSANGGRELLGPFTGIFRNNHDNTFTDLREALTPVSSGVVAWGDFDGDRDLDVLYSGTAKGPGTFLYRNLIRVTNAPPSAPTGLAVQSDQTLVWEAAADAETMGGAGLTYNLRLGTTPGAADIMSPHADPATGARRVPASGNAGLSRRWRVSLPPGLYYWSVQSVDAALVGSPFTTERVLAMPVVASAAQLALARPTAGQLELEVTGVPHERYRIESSADLSNWNELATEQASAKGVIVLTVPFTDPGRHFFRARLAP